MRDLYDVLGVSRGSTTEEIKRAYRQLARQLHPDANPDDPNAEARFKEVAQAYEVLSDPEKRHRYDTFGSAGIGNAGGTGDPFGGISDIFEAFFGGAGSGSAASSGPPRGTDVEVVADLALDVAVFGGAHSVSVRTAEACSECGHTGAAPGTTVQTCGDCRGTGQVRRVRQSFLGQMVSAGR